MDELNVFDYIKTQETSWKTARVPLTGSKDWNMSEHIERCTNVANAWFHQGKNDGLRPYDDIVTPIIDLSFRSEGFDVKDIVPYVDSAKDFYKSFLVKKYHPQWAQKNKLDTFIDEVVETSVIYDLVLVKDIKNVRPEVVDLKTIAFCDQTDVMAGPICLKHQYTPAELVAFKDKWDSEKIDMAIMLSMEEKKVSSANDQVVKTPSKYVEVYELRGNLPERWLGDSSELYSYKDQMHIVCFYTDTNGDKQGLTLYKGKDRPLNKNFYALKIDNVRSKGRACGRSIVERLFEPQVWNNYSAIKIKKMLDSAINIFQTDSDEYKNQKLSDLKDGTVLGHETGKPITKIDGNLQNIPSLQSFQARQELNARTLGSASDTQLGRNPASGTPFALENLVVQQGEGTHDYRRGKISSFFADVLYPELILQYLVDDMNSGKTFSEELSLDELQEVAEQITYCEIEKKIKNQILSGGRVPTEEEREVMREMFKEEFLSKGNRRFFQALKDELKDIPTKVKINVAGKQRYMGQNADKLSKLISNILANPQAFAMIPGLGKAYNELLEESGMSPIDFSQIISGVEENPGIKTQKMTSPVGAEELKDNKVLA